MSGNDKDEEITVVASHSGDMHLLNQEVHRKELKQVKLD